MKKIATFFAAAALLGFTACSNSENSEKKMAEEQNDQKFESTDMKSDADFAVKAASSGMLEVELGKLAVTNGYSTQVKEFGQNMVDDHSKANSELMAAAAAKNISLPGTMDNDAQKTLDDMRQKTGQDFDKAYMDKMVSAHKDNIDAFKKEAENGGDAQLKEWASGKLPTLQHHLEMAQSIKDNLK